MTRMVWTISWKKAQYMIKMASGEMTYGYMVIVEISTNLEI